MFDVLALDLGTHAGFAYNRGEEFACGTVTLGSAREIRQWGKTRLTRTADPRIGRLCKWLGDVGLFDCIVFEDVQFASSVYQVQLWSSLRAAVWLCGQAKHFEAVPVGTLKKFAGHGGADKEAMSRFLKARHPEKWNENLTDDEVDAVWLWLFAKHTFARMKT